jgi:hypothetical protein
MLSPGSISDDGYYNERGHLRQANTPSIPSNSIFIHQPGIQHQRNVFPRWNQHSRPTLYLERVRLISVIVEVEYDFVGSGARWHVK